MTQKLQWLSLALSLALLHACGGGSNDADSGLPDGSQLDAGSTTVDCTGLSDGDSCAAGSICVAESCVIAECGDGYVDEDAGEECDDGNGQAFDGCEPGSCLFTCSGDIQCDDREACNGPETCSPTEHFCVAAEHLPDTTACDLSGSDGVCRSGSCVAPGCGNAVPDGDEECDDGNEVDGDGCEVDCSYTCTVDDDCTDGDVCTGVETCDLSTHSCQTGTALTCDGGDACTTSECDPLMGCQYPLIDGDMDGHASTELGACGTDCNDIRPDVNPGEQEQCDAVDHDCSGAPEPDGTPYWYVDCDGDGYSLSLAGAIQSCEEPSAAMGPCTGTAESPWTSRRPDSSANTDCNDSNGSVHPGQNTYFTTAISGGGFDYNCSAPLPVADGTEYRYTTSYVSTAGTCSSFLGISCRGTVGYTGYRPTCGASGTYTYCRTVRCPTINPTCNPCARATRDQTQSCR